MFNTRHRRRIVLVTLLCQLLASLMMAMPTAQAGLPRNDNSAAVQCPDHTTASHTHARDVASIDSSAAGHANTGGDRVSHAGMGYVGADSGAQGHGRVSGCGQCNCPCAHGATPPADLTLAPRGTVASTLSTVIPGGHSATRPTVLFRPPI